MRDVLLSIQYTSIIGLFIESWVIFRRLKNSPLRYLFLSCIAILLNNVAYLFQLLSNSQESYVTALKISYLGRTWITLFLVFFTADLCHIAVPRLLKNFLVLIHIGIYVSVLTFQKHTLYYSWFYFSTERIFPKLVHGDGIIHHVYMLLQAAYIIFGFAWLFIAWHRERNSAKKKRLMTVIVSFFIECFFFTVQTFKLVSITQDYEVTMIGYVIGIVVMFIALFHYDLLGAKEIARDFLIDRLSEGIIAVDTNGNIQYFNKPAKEMYPNIDINSSQVLAEIKEAIQNGSGISVNNKIYTAEENDLVLKTKNFGKLYALIDSTEHYERFRREKDILQRELRIDPLTGLYNRKGMEYFSNRLCNEALESGKPLLVCICDMNGLKYINDNFGHDEGDKAIRKISEIIQASLINNDVAFRIGGDEFLILGIRDNENQAVDDFCTNLESIINESNKTQQSSYKVDMSYGPIIQKLSGTENEFSDLLKKSDSLMYEMKKSRDNHRR
ncbi:MAG: diguanylate cyclase [Treponema sp.]|nr:diguanylate cyclase [Treponema sp.]